MAEWMPLTFLGEKPRRRPRSSSGSRGLGKGMETVLTIGTIGGLAVVGYFVLKSGKGVEEFLQTGGGFLKNLTDAANASGEAIGNASCHIQKLFKPGLNCGAGYGGGDGDDDGGSEEKGILEKINDAVDKDIESKKKKYTEGPLMKLLGSVDYGRAAKNREGVADAILGFGCGWFRKC